MSDFTLPPLPPSIPQALESEEHSSPPAPYTTDPVLNKFSGTLTQSKQRGAAQAMLYATGISENDMDKPQIGVASCWYEGNPCNMHLLELGTQCKKGIQEQVSSSRGAKQRVTNIIFLRVIRMRW